MTPDHIFDRAVGFASGRFLGMADKPHSTKGMVVNLHNEPYDLWYKGSELDDGELLDIDALFSLFCPEKGKHYDFKLLFRCINDEEVYGLSNVILVDLSDDNQYMIDHHTVTVADVVMGDSAEVKAL